MVESGSAARQPRSHYLYNTLRCRHAPYSYLTQGLKLESVFDREWGEGGYASQCVLFRKRSRSHSHPHPP